jgi:hypothetical protein
MRKKIKLVKKKCNHDETEFEFSTKNTKNIENFLIIKGLTIMEGTCPECGEIIKEIAIGGLFELEVKATRCNNKKQNKSIKYPVNINDY